MSAFAKDTSPTLVTLFERQVARTPDATALIDGATEISFRELDAMVHHAAVQLRRAGIAPGDRVGHSFERSTAAIAALIAILKVGAAYMPIATDAPASRRDFLLHDSGAKAVVCGNDVVASLATCPVPVLPWTALMDAPHEPVEPLPEANVGPTSIAWVLYTSGSSGQPKGVLGTHRGCVTRIQALWTHQPFVPDERCFQHTAFTTVDSFWEILAPLCAGHALHVVGDGLIKDPERLLPHLAVLGIRRICMVPSLLALLVDLFPSLHAVVPDLKLWVVSGEPLSLDLCARFRTATRDARLFNQYGMTESCADVTSYDASEAGTAPISATFGTCLYAPIGRPFEGTETFVVDQQLNSVPDGVAGELCIVGECLSDGYLNRPELTQERFFTMPGEGARTARRALRTGDRVVRLPEGDLLYLGRIDSQINLRGYRIEPGEVEATIAAHEDVVQAAVVLQDFDALRKHLVAFVTLRPAGRVATQQDILAELKRHAEARLPAYMLPGTFVIVDAMPLTSSGKVDRQALASTCRAQRVGVGEVRAEQGTESQVAEVFATVLKLERVGATDNFFDIGGNSLIAMRAISVLRGRIGVNLPMSLVFENPTVRSLAKRIDEIQADDGNPVARITVRPPAAVPLMSFSQERLWFFEQLRPGTATYTISWNLRMRGALDRDALTRALDEIVRRHAVLRTHFSEHDGLGIQVVWDESGVVLDTQRVAECDLPQRLKACSNRSFDLENGPLHHFTLFELGPDDHCLSVAIHHAIFDGGSVQVMAEELCVLYTAFALGQASPLPPLAAQFMDYAHWQREWLDGEHTHNLLAYWREQLLGAPCALELPTDRPRPPVATYRGEHLSFSLPADTSHALRELARREGATLFMVLLAALNVVLSRWSGQRDIVVGSPISGRNEHETEPMIGFFVNTLALRTDLSGDPSFSALLQRVRQTALGAYAHQDLPFEKLVEALQPVRDLSRQAVFQVMLALHPEPAPLSMPKLQLDAWDGQSDSAKFDLTFELVDAASGIHGTLEFATDLWDDGTAKRFADHFENVLTAATRDPSIAISELTLMGEGETRSLLNAGSETCESYSQDQSIAARFEAQVALTPQAAALSVDGTTLSYAELDARASRLAAYLQDLGVEPDALVGLCVPRSLDMVVGLLAILKAGGAYVPIDPDYPADRITYMLTDSNAKVLITRSAIARRLPDSPAPRVLIDEDWPCIAASTGTTARKGLEAHHLAYVIYTSGTTGRPKGVMVQQRGLANLMQWFVHDIGIGADDAVLLVSSHSFDLTQKNIFGPLITGGVLHLAAEPFDPYAIVKQVQREAITFINCTPSAFYALIEANDGKQLRSLRRVMLGGEPIQLPKLMQLPEPRPQFINSYGPTECSDVDVFHLLSSELQRYRTGVPLGHAVRNTQLYVLDEHCRPVPQGVVGELYIAGVGVARGYLNRPDLTAERFVPNPFSHGARMYKTGDLVRWNADGILEYLGRIDHQVKLRGFRIETAEIEVALLECARVQQALVVACDDHRGQLHLVAYVVGDGSRHDESELRRHLEARLPKPMIPAAFMWLDQMPLSPNGKADRKALPAPALPSLQGAYVAPRSELEQSVAEIFADVLQLDRVGAEDDFFHLGGHSLLAMRVVARIRKALSRELPLRDLFENPTVALIAERLAPLAKCDIAAAPALRRSERVGPLPLSFAQERLWFLDRLGMGGITYNVPWVLRLDGAVDVRALELAIAEVLRRHEALRTRFADRSGKPEQIIDAPGPFSLPVQRLSPERLDESLQALAEQRFDLAIGPLCRFDLLQTGATTFHLSCVAHHIVCDGWSIDLMAEELCALYEAFVQGRPSPLRPMTAQYADYAIWQRAWLDEQRIHDQLVYWRKQLEGAPAALELPTDRPRPVEASYRGAFVPFSLPAETSQALHALAHREGVTLFMVLLAALNVVLSRWSGQTDIVVGSPIAGRTQRETEPMIGFFVNTLALRTDLSGDPSFSTLLQRVRRTALDAYAHQDLPFEKLVEALQPLRDLSRQAVFQVMLSLHTPKQSPAIPALALEATEGRTPTAKFDLSIEASLHQGVLHARLEYASDLFDHATMERLVGHFQRVLELAAEQPACPIGQLPMLSAAEREQQLVAWNATRTHYPDAHEALHHLFERQARSTPQAVALVHEGGQISYGELNGRANQLAHYLQALAIGTDTFVAVCTHRSPDMVVALLGILKAGAAYVPLDPSHPRQRLAYMLADTATPLLLTQQNLLEQLGDLALPALCLDGDAAVLDALPQHDPNLPTHPDQLAYCIYTSGSTGQPKGAMNSHRAIVNRLLWMQAQYQLDADDTVLQKTPYTFDVSVWEFFWPLMTGARLAIARPDGHKDPRYLAQAMRQYHVTTAHFVPAMLQAFLAQNQEALPALRRVFASGEALPASVARQFRQRHPKVALYNLYGPTEAAVDVSHWTCADDGDSVPIGYPVANTQLYLLDAALQPVPVGSTAEIYIAGVQLARGYLRRPDLTAERFVPNPYGDPGSRMYRTGDVGRYRPDGSIEYLGRTDHQVKLRGLRIELGEIENSLLGIPGVREAAVLVRHDRDHAQLVAYVSMREPAFGITELQNRLRVQLPDYMVPTAWVAMPALPLNANGKIDRKALPEPPVTRQDSAHAEPVSDTEKLIARIWSELFKVERIGLDDNFFALGGHSMLAVQTLWLVEQRAGVHIPIRDLFEAPTVLELASRIDKLRNVEASCDQ
ncbi:non-ribosomal peptide synthetase [Burkholderia multivorans]|nr:non-ribosomal peptide synthetase [Burkholderia multivorans]MBU9589636.1 amino acid adenylation domain-containing protein [Burkholderia multivorans]